MGKKQRMQIRITARFRRNEIRQVGNGPGQSRSDVILYQEPENDKSSGDEGYIPKSPLAPEPLLDDA